MMCNYCFIKKNNLINSFEQSISVHLQTVSNWMLTNNLSINPKKTKAIQFTLPRLIMQTPSISILGEPIQFVDHLKCLGIYLDQYLCFDRHVSYISSKVFFVLRRLYSLSSYMPCHIRKLAAHALLMSNINYCVEIIAGSSSGTLDRLQKVFNRVLRFIYSLRIRDHVTNYAVDFIGCTFKNYVLLRTLLCFFKALKYGVPFDLCSSFNFLHSSRNPQIYIPLIHYEIFSRSFQIRVARFWNTLPLELKSFTDSPIVYKRKLVTYLLNL